MRQPAYAQGTVASTIRDKVDTANRVRITDAGLPHRLPEVCRHAILDRTVKTGANRSAITGTWLQSNSASRSGRARSPGQTCCAPNQRPSARPGTPAGTADLGDPVAEEQIAPR